MQSQEASTIAGLPDRQAVLAAAAALLVAYSNCSLVGMKAKPGVLLTPKCTAGDAYSTTCSSCTACAASDTAALLCIRNLNEID